MNVRTRLQVSGVLPVLMALAVAATLAWVTTGVEELVVRMRAADSIVQDAFRLSAATFRFCRTPGSANRDMWIEFHTRIGTTLVRNRNAAIGQQDRVLFDEILDTHSAMRSIFGQMADLEMGQAEGKAGSSDSAGKMDSLQNELWARAALMAGGAGTLAANSHGRAIAIQEVAYLLIVGVTAVVAVLLALSASALGRRILVSIEELQTGTRAVQAGDLAYRVRVTGQDELSQLGEAFNRMTGELGQANSMLREEMRAKEETAQSLRNANVQLSESLSRLKRVQDEMVGQERLQALRQVSDGMVHDLNDTLMPVLGMSDYLLKYPDMLSRPDEVRECLTAIRESAGRASRVVRNLTEYFYPTGRQEAGNVNLTLVADEVLSLTEPMWKDRKMAEGVPIQCRKELAEIPLFLGGALDIREILMNLIVNAVEAMPKGGVFCVRTRRDGDVAVLEVEDTGVGMDADTRAHCFEPFFSTKGRNHAGMGLAVAMGCARQWGGTIQSCAASPGPGSVFTVRLPMRPKMPDARQSPQRKPARKLRILVVDDMPSVRSVVSRVLSHEGHVVETADRGQEALNRIAASSFDLLVLDRAMPDMSGDTVAAEVKRARPDTIVLMLTGFGDLMEQDGNRPVGVDLLLSKPVMADALLNAIAGLCA